MKKARIPNSGFLLILASTLAPKVIRSGQAMVARLAVGCCPLVPQELAHVPDED
jgi:hypothetical protein